MKIYTKTGDKGTTSLLGGQRVSKDDLRIESYGTIDELNSHLGMLISLTENEEITDDLLKIQSLLFNIGSYLASEDATHPSLPNLEESLVTDLEIGIDHMEKSLEPMTSFILPGGSLAIAQCHICRTVCRRAERRIIGAELEGEKIELIIKIVNRLSDYLFVLSRFIAADQGVADVPWIPDRS